MEPDNRARLERMLERHEGKKTRWYRDSEGNWTNGIGHLATKHDNVGEEWTEEKVESEFQLDLNIALRAIGRWRGWSGLDEIRQCALVDMTFNLGFSKVCEFHHMLAALEDSQWHLAHDAALASKWATEVGERARELANMMLSGQWQF